MDAYGSVWIAFLIVTSLEAALDADVVHSAKDLWTQHVKHVDGFQCGPPQKRAFKVVDLLEGQFVSSESYIPHSTVLHRCDAGAGCCKEALKVCKVAKAQDVEMMFYVINHINSTKEFRTLTFTNHTLCSCQISMNDIK